MDVMMPGLDGPTTFKRMRDSPLLSNIPVIFMTAKVMPQEITQLLNSGAIGVIGKPFDPNALCDQLFALWKGAQKAAPASTPVIKQSQLQTEIDTLAGSFLRRAREDAAYLRQMIERARRGDTAAFKEIERTGHSIHGAGAMFGFPAVSALGGAIESLAQRSLAEAEATSENCRLLQRIDSLAGLTQELHSATFTSNIDVGIFSRAVTAADETKLSPPNARRTNGTL